MSALLLVSGNGSSSPNKSGAVGKSFQPLLSKGFKMEKEPPLPLDFDVINLQEKYKKTGTSAINICESTIQKKQTLKERSKIIGEIKHNFSSNKQPFLYFTGHGYEDGDLCIETLENPEGERLTIEEILDIMIESTSDLINPCINIFIDASYSGHNVQRGKQHLIKKAFRGVVNIYCSSGPQYTSIHMPVGSLLIASLCEGSNPTIKEHKKLLAKKFEARKPLWLWYHWYQQMKESRISIHDLKF